MSYDAAKYHTIYLRKNDNTHKIVADMKCIRVSIWLYDVYRKILSRGSINSFSTKNKLATETVYERGKHGLFPNS